MRTICATVFLTVITLTVNAQIGNFLKQKGEEIGKKSSDRLKGKVSDKADAERDRLDSADFNYAISVIDNSGMLNIREKGEGLTKAAYTSSNLLLKDEEDITPAQKCRNLYE